MIWQACLTLALCAAGGAQPGATIDAPILIQLEQQELAKLPDWDGTLNGLRLALAERLELPEGACLDESPLARMARGDKTQLDTAAWMLLNVPAMPYERPVVEELVERLEASAAVLHAELDHDAAGWAESKTPDISAMPGVAPDDPLFPQQYYLHQIHAPEAWEISTGSPEVTVAVLDAGFDPGIQDLAGRVQPGYDFVADAAITVENAPHGTAIAALIGAAGNNGIGIAGMAWACRILPIGMTTGGVAVWAQAIDYAVSQGADVINISGKLDLQGPSEILDAALERAYRAGIVIVASAGNLDSPVIAWPASSAYVIAVGATDGFGRRWQRPLNVGSNYGADLDIVAPGASIVTLGRSGSRGQGDGTSPAAALVSGACALMLSVNPSLSPAEVRDILRRTAAKLGPTEIWKDGTSDEFGAGMLNTLKAVQAARESLNSKKSR